MNKEFALRVVGYCNKSPILRVVLINLRNTKSRKHPWKPLHPFDVTYGINTNKSLPWWLITSGKSSDLHSTGYAGCQPSCVRDALRAIPEPERRTFVDLGCGKGRAMVLASEFPFRHIVGVEISSYLVAQARHNIGLVEAKYPQRPRMEVAHGDAMLFPYPEGDLVVFLFHPFHRELVSALLIRLQEAAQLADREIFIIYENPVYGEVIDAAPWLQRWYSKTVFHAPEEVGHSVGDGELVVIWRNERHDPIRTSPLPGRESRMH